MNIAIIGTGYVGLVTGTCLAYLGNRVYCVDNDKEKIDILNKGKLPIYEKGLKSLIRKGITERRLFFTTSIKEAVDKSKVIFIAVNTPPRPNGEADLSFIEKVAREIAEIITEYKLIIDKSTVPVGTGKRILHTIKNYNKRNIEFDIASNPEFLREGTAVKDFLHPYRVVIGVETERAKRILLKLYKPLKAPVIVTNIESAELIKHASNSFLALKISYVNALANICESASADIKEVVKGMSFDKRISPYFLNAGVGYGGSCFPKDVAAFIRIAERLGCSFDLLKAVEKINHSQRLLIIKKLNETLWVLKDKLIGILGLAFKPDTDDIRNAPSLDIISLLLKEKANVKVYDPKAMNKVRKIFKNIQFCKDSYEVAKDADALVILTEWNEFKRLNLSKIKKLLKTPILVDGRNIFDPWRVKELGFTYLGIGRS